MERRTLLRAAALAGVPLPGAAAPGGPRVVALDYGLTETLLALGVVPVGLPDPADYRIWVIEPTLPEGPIDLGQRTQPNLELLSTLAPELILTVADHDPVVPQLRRIAPVLRLPIYAADRDPWARSAEAARAIGARLGREVAAQAVIADTERAFEEARALLQCCGQRPLLLGSFVDPRHLRIYGTGSILQAALDRLGLRNAWTGPTGPWGSATVGVEQLAPFAEAALFIFDPVPPDMDRVLASSPLWQALPFARAGRVTRLPPVLMFGTLPAAARFARVLLPHLVPGGVPGPATGAAHG